MCCEIAWEVMYRTDYHVFNDSRAMVQRMGNWRKKRTHTYEYIKYRKTMNKLYDEEDKYEIQKIHIWIGKFMRMKQ